MRMLLPTPTAVADPGALYGGALRRPPADRPYVVVNMIESLDGATTDADGTSGGLGGAADAAVLAAVRAAGDVVVAGAGTVRAENYGPARLSPDLQAARRARGQRPRPRIAVVSASLRLDPGMRLFREATPEDRPLIVTVEAADAAARHRLGEVADVVVAGDEQVDWRRALAALRREAGAGVVVAEGGPMVNGQLIADDLVDEVCVTVAPLLVGGEGARIAHGARPAAPRRLSLAHALEAEGYLLLRYLVERPDR